MPKKMYFRNKTAVKYGPSAATLLHEFVRLSLENKVANQNFCVNRYWVCISLSELAAKYPFWSKHQIESIIKKLREDGALLVDSFNVNPWDRTNWYSPSDEILTYYKGYPWENEV